LGGFYERRVFPWLNDKLSGAVESAGFRFESVRKFYLPKAPRTHAWFTVGLAAKAH
jgi:hypothetical protein